MAGERGPGTDRAWHGGAARGREVGGFVSHRNPAAPSTSGPAAILTVTRSAVTEGNLVIELVERQTGAVVYWAEAYDDNVTPWDASE